MSSKATGCRLTRLAYILDTSNLQNLACGPRLRAHQLPLGACCPWIKASSEAATAIADSMARVAASLTSSPSMAPTPLASAAMAMAADEALLAVRTVLDDPSKCAALTSSPGWALHPGAKLDLLPLPAAEYKRGACCAVPDTPADRSSSSNQFGKGPAGSGASMRPGKGCLGRGEASLPGTTGSDCSGACATTPACCHAARRRQKSRVFCRCSLSSSCLSASTSHWASRGPSAAAAAAALAKRGVSTAVWEDRCGDRALCGENPLEGKDVGDNALADIAGPVGETARIDTESRAAGPKPLLGADGVLFNAGRASSLIDTSLRPRGPNASGD